MKIRTWIDFFPQWLNTWLFCVSFVVYIEFCFRNQNFRSGPMPLINYTTGPCDIYELIQCVLYGVFGSLIRHFITCRSRGSRTRVSVNFKQISSDILRSCFIPRPYYSFIKIRLSSAAYCGIFIRVSIRSIERNQVSRTELEGESCFFLGFF